MARIRGSSEVLEARRRAALAIFDSGCSYTEVGRAMGCAPSSVMRWAAMRRSRRGLGVIRSPGRPRRVAYEKIVTVLRKNGKRLRTARVTTKIVNRLLRADYDVEHVRRLLTKLGWKWVRGKGWVEARVRDEAV